MTRNWFAVAAFTLTTVGTVPAVLAQQSIPATAADAMFVEKAARGGMAEVELGRLAVEKGFTPEVKRFGQRMVDDHGKAGEELALLAKHKGIPLPSDVSAEHKAEKMKLAALSGEAFDRAYMQAMLNGHRKVAQEFSTESRLGTDVEIKAWAAKTLPTVERHVVMAQEAQRAIKENPIHR